MNPKTSKGRSNPRQKVVATIRGGMRRKAPKAKRPSGVSGYNTGRGGRGNAGLSVRSAPSAVGVVIPSAYFGFDGKAQQMTDIGGMGDNCRVVGCDLFGPPIQSAASGSGGFNNAYWQVLTPGNISTRLQNLEELFMYYAIRRLRVMYSPEVSTATNGSFALALAQDINVDSVTSPTQQQLLEVTPSMKAPFYMVSQMEYVHNGTKVWATSTEGSEILSGDTQAVLGCALQGAAASTVFGALWVEYIIDFYKPSMVLGSPARALRDKACRDYQKRAAEFKKARELATTGNSLEHKKIPSLDQTLEEDYQSVSSTPRVPSDERKSEREASVERKPVASGGPRSGLFR